MLGHPKNLQPNKLALRQTRRTAVKKKLIAAQSSRILKEFGRALIFKVRHRRLDSQSMGLFRSCLKIDRVIALKR
jgi:hypothetical protein